MTIKESLALTREKRKFQVCKVFEIKFDYSHLSKEKQKYLKTLFLEAKWIYNNILSSENIFDYSYKLKQVKVLNKDKQEEVREIHNLSSQMRQELVDRTKQNIINLSKKKSVGFKIGKLKFKKEINSISLKQHGVTYKIINNKYIKLQGFKKPFKVLGLEQILKEYEIANANIVRKNGNYYLKITTFQNIIMKQKTGKQVGLDFGIKDSVVDSNGNKFNFRFPEPKQLKRVSKELNRKLKGSSNRFSQKLKLNKQYEKLTNQKKDTINKFVSKLLKENDLICVQDEMIHQWAKSKRKGFGRRIQHGIIGGIISKLKHNSETLVVPRSFPSTQLCPKCGSLNKHSIDKRIYNCDCGYSRDRDTHSANNILTEGLKIISREPRNPMPVEKMLDLGIQTKQFSVKQEAQCFSIG